MRPTNNIVPRWVIGQCQESCSAAIHVIVIDGWIWCRAWHAVVVAIMMARGGQGDSGVARGFGSESIVSQNGWCPTLSGAHVSHRIDQQINGIWLIQFIVISFFSTQTPQSPIATGSMWGCTLKSHYRTPLHKTCEYSQSADETDVCGRTDDYRSTIHHHPLVQRARLLLVEEEKNEENSFIWTYEQNLPRNEPSRVRDFVELPLPVWHVCCCKSCVRTSSEYSTSQQVWWERY